MTNKIPTHVTIVLSQLNDYNENNKEYITSNLTNQVQLVFGMKLQALITNKYNNTSRSKRRGVNIFGTKI